MNIEKLYELEAQLEKSLDQVRGHIREEINRQGLNKINNNPKHQERLWTEFWMKDPYE